VQIRPLDEKQYKSCVDLLNLSFEEIKTDYITLNELENEAKKGTIFYGLFNKDKLIGCIGLIQKSEESYKIVRLAVLSEYRHKGYGENLMEHAETIAILNGGLKMSLGFRSQNEELKKWYLNLGYEIEKIKTYKDNKSDICFAKKKLAARPPFEIMNPRVENCKECGFPLEVCICDIEEKLKMDHKFVIIMHPEEVSRVTNTGRLIKKSFPDDTEVFYWNRTNVNSKLLKILKSDEYYKVLVFPPDKKEHNHRAITNETIKNIVKTEPENIETKEKKIMFVILDGTWKEARKIIRKSPYLEDLKMLELDTNIKTEYDLRRNSDIGHICTVEVVIELLKLINEKVKAEKLYKYFEVFLNRYDEGKRL